jgi:hypothetical protein
MSRPAAFRQDDVKRAVKGATAGGMRVTHVEIGADGTIKLFSLDEPVANLANDAKLMLGRIASKPWRTSR